MADKRLFALGLGLGYLASRRGKRNPSPRRNAKRATPKERKAVAELAAKVGIAEAMRQTGRSKYAIQAWIKEFGLESTKMDARSRHSAEEWSKIVKRAVKVGADQAAKENSVSGAMVRRWAKKLAINLPSRRKNDEERESQIRDAVERAKKIGRAKVAAQMGVDPITVSRWAKRLGVKLTERSTPDRISTPEERERAVAKASQVGVSQAVEETGWPEKSIKRWARESGSPLPDERSIRFTAPGFSKLKDMYPLLYLGSEIPTYDRGRSRYVVESPLYSSTQYLSRKGLTIPADNNSIPLRYGIKKIDWDEEYSSGEVIEIKAARSQVPLISPRLKAKLEDIKSYYDDNFEISLRDILYGWPIDFTGPLALRLYLDPDKKGAWQKTRYYKFLRDAEKIDWDREFADGNAVWLTQRQDLRVTSELAKRLETTRANFTQRVIEDQKMRATLNLCSVLPQGKQGTREQWFSWKYGEKRKPAKYWEETGSRAPASIYGKTPDPEAIERVIKEEGTADWPNCSAFINLYRGYPVKITAKTTRCLRKSREYGYEKASRTGEIFSFLFGGRLKEPELDFYRDFLIDRCWSCFRQEPLWQDSYKFLTLDHIIANHTITSSQYRGDYNKATLIHTLIEELAQKRGRNADRLRRQYCAGEADLGLQLDPKYSRKRIAITGHTDLFSSQKRIKTLIKNGTALRPQSRAVMESVSPNTDLLIVAADGKDTNKARDARRLKIPTITEFKFFNDQLSFDQEIAPSATWTGKNIKAFRRIEEKVNSCKEAIRNARNWQPLCKRCNVRKVSPPFVAAYFKWAALAKLWEMVQGLSYEQAKALKKDLNHNGLRKPLVESYSWNRKVKGYIYIGSYGTLGKLYGDPDIYCKAPVNFYEKKWLPGSATQPGDWGWWREPLDKDDQEAINEYNEKMIAQDERRKRR